MPTHIRVNELARELRVRVADVLHALQRMGLTRRLTHSSSIEIDLAERLRRELRAEAEITEEPQVLALPKSFTFYRGFVDFDNVLTHMDWGHSNCPVIIDLTTCTSANFQAIALLIQYGWELTLQGCAVTFRYGVAMAGPTKMINNMGASRWREILLDDGRDFETRPGGQTFALRRRSDVQGTINRARNAINSYSIRFPDYLSYIVSELLYNATEHGRRQAVVGGSQVLVPAIFRFGYYPRFDRVSFLFSDLGVGIKAHLEQTYPPFSTHQEAIIHALQPRISGTFRQQAEPYAAKNNAGLGLTYSSRMLKHLKGDMYIVSYDGVVHVSPEDVTSRKLLQWIKIRNAPTAIREIIDGVLEDNLPRFQ